MIVDTRMFRSTTEFFEYNYLQKDTKDINFIYMYMYVILDILIGWVENNELEVLIYFCNQTCCVEHKWAVRYC